MGKKIVAAICLVVAGWLAAATFDPSGTRNVVGATQPVAGMPAAIPPLEVGKQYTFYWERGAIINATALDAPRGHWIKVQHRLESGESAVHWVNLTTVTYLVELPKAK